MAQKNYVVGNYYHDNYWHTDFVVLGIDGSQITIFRKGEGVVTHYTGFDEQFIKPFDSHGNCPVATSHRPHDCLGNNN